MSPAAAVADLDSARAREIEISHQTKQYLDNQPWDEERVVMQLRELHASIAHAILAAGQRLLAAKLNVPPGRWGEFLERTGVGERSAQRYMLFAKRFGSSEQIKKLSWGTTKLRLLDEFPEEDLRNFEETGTLCGHDTNELSALTRAEIEKMARDSQRRVEEAKTQVQELEAENQALKTRLDPAAAAAAAPTDPELAQVQRLDSLRAGMYAELDAVALQVRQLRGAVALYSTLSALQLECARRMRELEEREDFGGLLGLAAQGYTPELARQMSLGEYVEDAIQDTDTLDIEDI